MAESNASAPALAEFDVNGLAGALDDLPGTEQSYKWAYWRQPNGWIVVAPNWPTEFMRQVREKWTPLEKYGEFKLTEVALRPNGTVGGVWHVNREPYRLLFKKGGIHELTPGQIREHGWHRRPPYKGVSFPQLAEEPHEDVQCALCKRFFLTDENLTAHESIRHEKQSQNQGLARALKEAQDLANTNPNKALEMMAQAIRQMADMMQEIQGGTLSAARSSVARSHHAARPARRAAAPAPLERDAVEADDEEVPA